MVNVFIPFNFLIFHAIYSMFLGTLASPSECLEVWVSQLIQLHGGL
jgi:hypothetical protein